MEDDFFIEDVLKNLGKKNRIDSSGKGRRGENDLCKVLIKRFPNHKGFFRVIGSGNRWAQATLTEEANRVLTADVVCPEGFKFSIECKYGYKKIDLSSSFEHGNKQIDEFLAKTARDAQRTNKKPLLCWRKQWQSWLAFIKKVDYESNQSIKYKFDYRDWIIVSLTSLLRNDDNFFFK